jgi:para-aminobenzoate synthetase component 1
MGDIIFDMLPAGSCTGAPKKSTVDIIRRAEGENRGYYTGVFGYFDGSSLDSAVLIRFIEKENDSFFFRSGGGITARSNWKNEYQETLQKIYLPL